MTARAARAIAAGAESAFAVWVDVSRWEAFIDGFARVESLDDRWPAAGAEVVWVSGPAGRGRVRERVVECDAGRSLVTEVEEDQLTGRQRVEFARDGDGDGCAALLSLEYALRARGPLSRLADVLFIRRAENDALRRTLDRFAAEAAPETAV